MKVTNMVRWDNYGIKNNPSKEALVRELDRLTVTQLKGLNNPNTNMSQNNMIQRQHKINITRELILNFKD